jgi:acyl-CoA thioesterase I
VGDQHESRVALAVQREHQLDDLLARRQVEVAGRLVGEQDRRLHHQRTGERHTLLLAAGELGGIVGEPLGEADTVELGRGAGERVGAAGKLQRHGDVFKRGHVLDEMEGLEDDADIGAAEPGQGILVKSRQIFARHDHPAGARRLEAGCDHQQGRFAGARRSDDADGFPGPYIEANTPENVNLRSPAAERQMNIFQTDGVMRHVTRLPRHGRSGTYGTLLAGLQATAVTTLGIVTLAVALWFTPAGADTGPIRLVALGDSLSAGYMLAPGDAFPVKLEAALKSRGHDVVVENAGVSGDTTSGGLARLDWSVPAETDGVILELGANDALRGLDLAVTRSALEEIAQRLDERGVAVLVAGMMAPPNLGEPYVGDFNALYPALAQRYGFLLYPFFLDGIAADPSLNLDDGMHPNPQGVDVIVERILPYVEELIARIETGAPTKTGG